MNSAAKATGGFVVDRPPTGLARGKYPAPAWAITVLGATLVLGTLLYFVLRFRKSRS